jgi:hypothetical protein
VLQWLVGHRTRRWSRHRLPRPSGHCTALLYVFLCFSSVPSAQIVLLVFLVLTSTATVISAHFVLNQCSIRDQSVLHLCSAVLLCSPSAAYLACYSALVFLSAHELSQCSLSSSCVPVGHYDWVLVQCNQLSLHPPPNRPCVIQLLLWPGLCGAPMVWCMCLPMLASKIHLWACFMWYLVPCNELSTGGSKSYRNRGFYLNWLRPKYCSITDCNVQYTLATPQNTIGRC